MFYQISFWGMAQLYTAQPTMFLSNIFWSIVLLNPAQITFHQISFEVWLCYYTQHKQQVELLYHITIKVLQ